jgi:hypothetical protein
MSTDEIKEELNNLDGFVQGLSNFSDTPSDFSMFSSLIKCSLIKNYEFLKLVFHEDKFEKYFFATSFLRSIVEDVIVLESLHSFAAEKREKLLKGIQLLEVKERILKQWNFFQKYRPFQPVIDKGYTFNEAKADVQNIWRENGWPKFEVTATKLMPPTVDLARKLAPGILDILYEFIFRLSSGTVHFSPQTLLRMSWGNIDSEKNISGTISVNHMANYHKAFCQTYGTLLFTFYFEFFSDEIKATPTEQAIVVKIRKHLLEEIRWPEMITFEEMNLPVPKAYHDKILVYAVIHQIIIENLKEGFVKNNYEKFLKTAQDAKDKSCEKCGSFNVIEIGEKFLCEECVAQAGCGCGGSATDDE